MRIADGAEHDDLGAGLPQWLDERGSVAGNGTEIDIEKCQIWAPAQLALKLVDGGSQQNLHVESRSPHRFGQRLRYQGMVLDDQHPGDVVGPC